MSEEIRSLKVTVATLRRQLDTVISFLGITDTNSFSAHEFPPLTGVHPVQCDVNINSNTTVADEATEKAGVENAGVAKMQGWKSREWKTRHQTAGVENAGV